MHKTFETGHQMRTKSPILIFLLLAFFPIVGMAVLGLGVWMYIGSIKQGLSIGFIILSSGYAVAVGIFLLILGWLAISDGLVRYKISPEGVYGLFFL